MFQMRTVVIALALTGVLCTALACGARTQADSEAPGPDDRAAAATSPEPENTTSAAISAQPEEGDGAIESGASVGFLCQWFRGVNIMLSDHSGDTADSVGNWRPMTTDIEAPYHRLTITLEELPAAPGEYPAVGLKYSVHDDAAGPFNYGWQMVQGTVLITDTSGVVAPEDNGPLEGATLAGTFDISNSRGGRFTGRFSIGSKE